MAMVNEPRPVIFCALSDDYKGTMQQKEGEDLSFGYMFKKIKFALTSFGGFGYMFGGVYNWKLSPKTNI